MTNVVGVRDLISCRPGLEPGPTPRDFPFARYGRRPSHNRRRGVWVPARRPGRRTVAMHTAHRFQLSRSACSQTQLRILAARCARALRSVAALESKRVQGKPGARCTRGLVCKNAWKNAHEHTGSAESIRPSLRNGFTAYFAISPVRRALLPPSPARSCFPRTWRQRRAPGPRDFAVRLNHARQSQPCASTASHRTFVTIAIRPSHRVRRANS